MIEIFKNTTQQKKLAKIDGFARMSWINILSPTEEEKLKICELLNMPSEVLEDSLDEYELPRVKSQDGNLIIILRAAIEEKGAYRTTPLTIIINESHIVTISLSEIGFISDFIKGRFDIITTQQSNFFIRTCHRLVESYQIYITAISRGVSQKKSNLKNINKNDILFLVETEEFLNMLNSSLVPTINVVNKILNYSYIHLYRNDKELISDLLVDGQQVAELSNTTLRTIRNIRDGYTTVMSINLNQIIEILTYITAIFTIPMIMFSAYGMNIDLPFSNHAYAFLIVAFITASLMAIAVVLFIKFKKKF